MMQQKTELVERFDKDGDKRLNAAERKAARESLAQQPFRRRGPRGPGGPGFPRRDGYRQTPQPGQRLTPADVESYPDAPLYAPHILRTLFLEFEDADWESELADFKNTDVEVPARLTVDGKVYPDVGVHFRGMSSFSMVGEGWKRSLSLSLDYVHKGQQIDGYRTLHLLNSHMDPTFLRSILFFQIAREYIPAPKANLVRVVINGESWGVYVNQQHFNKEFIREWFGTTKGARWKVPGSPGGRGSLAYLGDDVGSYKRIYEIKTKDDPTSWAHLIRLCQVLSQTPADQLETALAPVLDIDGALKFLALDNVLINDDGYWIRSSDYNLYEDTNGRFHIITCDANETFSLPGGPGFGPGRGGPPGPGGGPGFAGRPGPGVFGPGMILARPMLTQADRNSDQKLTKEELIALADAWFNKFDSGKTGKLSQEDFTTGLREFLPEPPGFAPPPDGQQPAGARGAFGPALFIGPGLFRAIDTNQDGTLTRTELEDVFGKWFSEWDSDRSGSLTEDKLATGLNAVLPRPDFRGPGGGFPGPGGGLGRGGFGFGGGPGSSGVQLDPLIVANDPNKPLISKLLAVPSLRKRYLAYVRDICEKWLDWNRLGPVAQEYHSLIAAEVKADTRKVDSTEAFLSGLTGNGQTGGFGGTSISLKTFADQRRAYLLNHPEVKNARLYTDAP